MSRSINKAIIVGNVGVDPEVRTTGSGTKVATLSVATNHRYTDRSGQAQEETEWHRIVFWDKLADVIEQYVRKGDRIYVEGRIKSRKWTDNNNQERTTFEIIAREMVLLGSASGGGNGQGSNNTRAAQPRPQPQPAAAAPFDADDDLPF